MDLTLAFDVVRHAVLCDMPSGTRTTGGTGSRSAGCGTGEATPDTIAPVVDLLAGQLAKWPDGLPAACPAGAGPSALVSAGP
jgi:hypothetical protein